MRIAIFSDIHGKLLLPFKLVDLYQKETGKKVDFILQCGDLGAYPYLEKLDKATIKHAQQDRDELGFHDDFMKADPGINSFLEKLGINMICVRGNHEDHDYLDDLEEQHQPASKFPIDVYQRVWMCRSGCRQDLEAENEALSLVGIGRIGDRKGRSEKRFIQNYERMEVKKLYKGKGVFDILITHDKAGALEGDYGMKEIRDLLDNVIFQYHFYGHTGEPFKQETDDNGITTSVKVMELEFGSSGILPAGCMIVLEKKDGAPIQLEIIDQKLTNKLTKYNWKEA